MDSSVCSHPRCPGLTVTRGLCARHYARLLRGTDLDGPAMGRPFAERFWEKVLKTPGGCWLWTGSVDHHGYGHMKDGRRVRRAHRVAWELTHGAIRRDQYVCHRCDTPSCVNPAHFFLGTHAENMRDAVLKGRMGRYPEKRRTVEEVLS